MTNSNPWEKAKQQLHKTGTTLGIDPLLLAHLSDPEKIIEVSLPLQKDSGEIMTLKGYRVQHNSHHGPYKGGLRYHQDVSMDEVKALAFWMSMKTALLGIPFGGGKGGITVDPKSLSEGELERLTRLFTKRLFHTIGPDKDIPAPDVNTNPKIMGWIMDEYSKTLGTAAPGVVTGKPIALGGSEGRTEATGLGGSFVLREIVRRMGHKPEDLTVAIQGFGNVGRYVAEYLQAEGFKIVALTDSKGGIYIPDGVGPIDQIQQWREEKGYLAGCYCVGSVCDRNNKATLHGRDIAPDEILTLPVDILVPAALGDVLTKEIAPQVQAKIILEMANGPTTAEAEEILIEKGITIIPDILANSGGVLVSYFEWLQNRDHQSWSKEKVFIKLEAQMIQAAETVSSMAQTSHISLREAAYSVALKKFEKTWNDKHAS